VGFALGVTAGVAGAVDVNDALAAGTFATADEAGVIGFKLADDGNVEGVA
jgi:hypothetical protein